MNLETLQKFCHSWNSKMALPFKDGNYTYSTDGCILLRIPEILTDQTYDKFPRETIEANFSQPTEEPLPLRGFWTEVQTEKCKTCKGTGKISECPECEGSGEIEWDTGYNFYSVECESCNGHGTLSNGEAGEDCEDCEGTGEISIRTLVKVGEAQFDNRLLNKLIDNLPNDATIAPARLGPIQPAILSWNGGEGLLMPVRAT